MPLRLDIDRDNGSTFSVNIQFCILNGKIERKIEEK
jgi:hypothetical protein